MAEKLVPEGEPVARTHCAELDALLGRPFRIGDGFLSVVDYMGSDLAVRDAALAYTQREPEESPQTMRRFMLNQHMAPLNAYHITFHVQAPVCLARQWLRLRTVAQRDLPMRYHTLTTEFFLPSGMHWSLSKCEVPLDELAITLHKLKTEALDCFADYNGGAGLRTFYGFTVPTGPPDNLPGQQEPVQFCWCVSVANLLNFLHPNWGPSEELDIPEYQRVMEQVMEVWLPSVWTTYQEYGRQDLVLTERDRIIVQRLLAQHNNVHQLDLAFSDLDISEGEKSEILVKLRSLGFNPDTPQSH